MIDEKCLEKLRRHWSEIVTGKPFPTAMLIEIQPPLAADILDTLSAALKVVRAAQKLDQEFDGALLEGERITVREWTGLKEALAPFEEGK